jgi:hypothetical protein
MSIRLRSGAVCLGCHAINQRIDLSRLREALHRMPVSPWE